MWKRDEAVKPTSGQPGSSPAPVVSTPSASPSAAPQPESRRIERDMELKDQVLTIGPNGKIKAQVFAKAVIVLGEVNGNVTASEKVDIRDGGSVDGDIIAPRVAIAEGAHFRGSVDMQRKGGQPAAKESQKAASQPAPQAQAQPQAAAH
jgi:cytoskeletal protein CcmA (bactofilin family)